MENIQPSRKIIFPFRIQIDPMEKLLVANFRGDPEFIGVEPQTFDDANNGRGMRVLRYRKNGKVDVYWQPGVKVDPNSFAIGKGISDFTETEISPSRFEITEHGVDLQFAFKDLQGRTTELNIHENAPGKRGFPLLAPVSADIENPIQFTLVYMPEIDLVRRSGTTYSGRIGNRVLRPDTFPILLGGHGAWFSRYAAGPIIGTLNPPMNHPVIAELSGTGSVEVDGMWVLADPNGNLTRICAGQGTSRVEVDFSPGFPNLDGFADGKSFSGRWIIKVAGVHITGGVFSVSSLDGRIAVELAGIEPWKPANLPLSIDLFTRVVRVFRTWPSTYRWRGVVEPSAMPSMSGKWERVRKS